MSQFAILYDPSAYSMKGKVMGRQSTGAAFLKAIADARLSTLGCYTGSRAAAQECAQQIAELGAPRTGVAWYPYGEPERLREIGLLYRPDPGIGQHAWHRLTRADPRAYSICGITHTISSHGPMSAFAEYLTAPVESWDAVICTSRGARDAIRHVLEAQAEHLRDRVGATRFSLPQLPVIPLGIHTRQFARTPSARAAARQALSLAEDEVAVLFAGRLIVHGKAHPLAMYLALEEAAKGQKVVLIQAGQAPNPEVLSVFIDEPARFCPSVRVVMVDGADFARYQAAWAAADIFTSLSDNIQETFGLTPIEAMASGLPVVVSDWDGYKDTVRDGVDGFRVPTLALSPGQGGILADRFDMGLDNFDYYSGYASQLVAVDVTAAAQAYHRLIADKDLRVRMGAAGQERARTVFDWAVVFGRYQALWDELAERRRSDPQLLASTRARRRPDRADPFAMFASYPTYHLESLTRFRRRDGVSLEDALTRQELASTKFSAPVQPAPELVRVLFSCLGSSWMTSADLIQELPQTMVEALPSALVWLSKVGALDFSR